MSKTACLGGKEIAALLRGEKVTAYGVDFIYDATDYFRVQEALDGLRRMQGGDAKKPSEGRAPARGEIK